MDEVHHFSYGLITPVAAYGMSVLGSLLGLVCASRARDAGRLGQRLRWLFAAALAIGGTGIWLMHFLAILGFTVPGSEVRFAVVSTAVSAALAVGVVGAGLLFVGTGRVVVWKLVLAGLFTGVGVAAMHYTGMYAMQVGGTISYRYPLVAVSVVIAVVAATVALWFTTVLRGMLAVTVGAIVMGVAVTGMHYVGMAAVRVDLDGRRGAVPGADVTTFLLPIVFAVAVIVAALLYALLSAPTAEDKAAEELLLRVRNGRTSAYPVTTIPSPRDGDITEMYDAAAWPVADRSRSAERF